MLSEHSVVELLVDPQPFLNQAIQFASHRRDDVPLFRLDEDSNRSSNGEPVPPRFFPTLLIIQNDELSVQFACKCDGRPLPTAHVFPNGIQASSSCLLPLKNVLLHVRLNPASGLIRLNIDFLQYGSRNDYPLIERGEEPQPIGARKQE